MVIQDKFLNDYKDFAIQTQSKTKIPASVTLAQAALESGWGKYADGNNFFGIKGTGPAGSVLKYTKEYLNGQMVQVKQYFRKYNSPLESFIDHAEFIMNSKWLNHAMQHTDSAFNFISALQAKPIKYATDPQYVDKIMSIIKQYDLENYDNSSKQLKSF